MKVRILIMLIAVLFSFPHITLCCDTSGDCCEEIEPELRGFTGTCAETTCDKSTCTADNFPEASNGFIPPTCHYDLPWYLNGGYAWLCWATYSSGSVFHPALDLNRPGGEEPNEPVHAAANGYVIDIKYEPEEMSVVLIKHKWRGETWYTAYWHMKSISVSEGDCVCRGQVIGEVADVGSPGQKHLHYEVRSADHPYAETADWWGSELADAENVQSWYRDPLLFTTTHLPYTCDSSSIFRDLSCWHWAYDYWITMKDEGIFSVSGCPLSAVASKGRFHRKWR